jgi:hypothetical protein
MAQPQLTTVSPQLTFIISSLLGSNPNPLTIQELVTSYTGSNIYYNAYFPIKGSSQNVIPYNGDPSAGLNNNVPVVYVRNVDQSAVVALQFFSPDGFGGVSSNSIVVMLSPGGIFLCYNPFNTQSGPDGPTTPVKNIPVGLGIGLTSLSVQSPGTTTQTPITYCEVLMAT